jgi:hypothetical protein
MKRFAVCLLLTAAACTPANFEATSTTATSTTTTTLPTTLPTTTTSPPVECPAPPYDLTFLPTGVGLTPMDLDELEPDVWTSVGGTQTTFIGRTNGTVAIALIRGTLPAVDWPAEKGEVEIDGTRAAVGPHPDGTWVAGWFEEPRERCDRYSMVFYPPWAPAEVEMVLEGMNRVGG